MATDREIINNDAQQIDGFVDGFDSTISDFERNTLVVAGTIAGLGMSIGEIDGLIEQSLGNSGYYDMLNDMINNGYQQILDEELGILRDIVGETVSISDETMAKLMTQKEIDLRQFGQITDDIKNKLSRELYQFSQGNITRAQLTNNISNITAQYSQWTKTWVDTSLSGFKQQTSLIIGTENGVKNWEYKGPMDGLTRPFCRNHVGEVKTIKQWDELDNGQILPVSIYRGGYNCRHRLVGAE